MLPPRDTPEPPTPVTPLGTTLRTLRQAAGLTQQRCAHTARVHVTTWRAWESGAKTPRLTRARDIARALGVHPGALLEPGAGVVSVGEVTLSAAAVERVRLEGEPAAVELAGQLARALVPELLAAVRTPKPARRDGRGKPRRTRAEVLAAIAAAETRPGSQTRARTRGGGEGLHDRPVLRLPGSQSYSGVVDGLSTFTAEAD